MPGNDYSYVKNSFLSHFLQFLHSLTIEFIRCYLDTVMGSVVKWTKINKFNFYVILRGILPVSQRYTLSSRLITYSNCMWWALRNFVIFSHKCAFALWPSCAVPPCSVLKTSEVILRELQFYPWLIAPSLSNLTCAALLQQNFVLTEWISFINSSPSLFCDRSIAFPQASSPLCAI